MTSESCPCGRSSEVGLGGWGFNGLGGVGIRSIARSRQNIRCLIWRSEGFVFSRPGFYISLEVRLLRGKYCDAGTDHGEDGAAVLVKSAYDTIGVVR